METTANANKNAHSEMLAAIRTAKSTGARDLFLSSLGLEVLSDELMDLKEVRNIYLFDNKFKVFPSQICALENLEVLYISGNLIESIPAQISQLKELKLLDLKNNNLTTIPSEIGALEKLEKLYLCHNSIEQFPETLGALKALTHLDLSNNKCAKIGAWIGRLTALKSCLLNHNQLTTLPPEMGRLGMLDKLHVHYNHLQGFPQELTQLTSLKSNNQKYEWERGLRLENNKYELSQEQELLEPQDLLKFVATGVSALAATNLPGVEKQKIKQVQPVVKSVTVQSNPFKIKLNVFGESEFKVQQQLSALFGESDQGKYPMNLAGNSYLIEVSNYGFLPINCYDSGLLKSEDAINLVFNAKGGVIGAIRKKIARKTIVIGARKVKNKPFFSASFSGRISEKKLIKIYKAIAKTASKYSDQKLPNKYKQLHTLCANTSKSFIEYSEFSSLASKMGFDNPILKRKALKKLGQSGLCYTFDNSLALQHKILVNKAGLHGLLKHVFSSIDLAKNMGVIKNTDLDLIAQQSSEKKGIQGIELMHLLIENGWAYSLNRGELLLPYFLPNDPPEIDWDSSNEVVLRYAFKTSDVSRVFYEFMGRFTNKAYTTYFGNKECWLK